MNIGFTGKFIGILSRQEQKFMKHYMKQYGLSYTSYNFLLYIASHDGCSQKEISEGMIVDEALATRAVGLLQREGYVERIRRKDNARTYEITLTDIGKALVPEVRKALNKWWGEVLSDYTEEEIEKFVSQLEEMAVRSWNIIRQMERMEE